MEERMTVNEIVEGAMREKKMSVARLAELTDIPERYVGLLVRGERQGLPPAPYVRGYVIRIAEALNLDSGQVWQVYMEQQELKTSGEGDTLPTNRFAFKRVNKKGIMAVVVVLAVVAMAGFWTWKIAGREGIDVKNPAESGVVVYEPSIDLRGKINPGERLTINNEDVAIDRNGYFEKNFSLEPGINTVEFKVRRLLGKEDSVVRQIIYQQ